MTYQLVIKIISGSEKEDLAWLHKVEDFLIDLLEPDHAVDGHDVGQDGMNIYVLTDTPQEAFLRSKTVFSDHELDNIVAAYREETGKEYIVIWPPDFAGEPRIN